MAHYDAIIWVLSAQICPHMYLWPPAFSPRELHSLNVSSFWPFYKNPRVVCVGKCQQISSFQITQTSPPGTNNHVQRHLNRLFSAFWCSGWTSARLDAKFHWLAAVWLFDQIFALMSDWTCVTYKVSVTVVRQLYLVHVDSREQKTFICIYYCLMINLYQHNHTIPQDVNKIRCPVLALK